MWLFLRREGLRFKKTLFALEQARRDVAQRRQRWKRMRRRLEPSRLVFIDETPDQVRGRLWIKTNMAPPRGWGVKGQRIRGFAPHGHWRTMTFLAALRCDGITAPFVLDGAINGTWFRLYVEWMLILTLKPGDIVITDNLASHKGAAIRNALQEAGASLWFLPPYSPDLNPIEQTFAKIKHRMRLAQTRSQQDTWRHAGQLLDTITPRECANYFRNAGYASN